MLRKEAIKIMKGERPDINTGTAAQVAPLEKDAKAAVKGAIVHISQVTRLGLVCPLNMDRT